MLDEWVTTTTYDDGGRPMLQATTKNGRMQSRVLYESTAEWVDGQYVTPGSLLRNYQQQFLGSMATLTGSSGSSGTTSSKGARAMSKYEGPPPAPLSWLTRLRRVLWAFGHRWY